MKEIKNKNTIVKYFEKKNLKLSYQLHILFFIFRQTLIYRHSLTLVLKDRIFT